MPGDFQVFISYARKDNESPPGGGSGFVSCFHEQLSFRLNDLGASSITIWRDAGHIDDVDQFDPMLESAIGKSALLLIILSANWMQRPHCRLELEQFATRWAKAGEDGLKRRIMVVRKRPVDRKTWPAQLQGQVGLAFFSDENPEKPGQEHEFFWEGKVRDDRYHDCMRKLAGSIVAATSSFSSEEASLSPAAPLGAPAPPAALLVVPPPPVIPSAAPAAPAPPPPRGRTVFVAWPANDMSASYDRIVRELDGRGFGVAPSGKIPDDASATAFIDAALAAAEFSVHLVGEKAGFAPEDAEPIVKLQLDRAALRAAASANAPAPFRRIVWAPKILEAVAGAPLATGASPSVERDPLAVLAKLSPQLPGDKIDGQSLSKFVDFLVQAIIVDEPPARAPASPGHATKVYLYHAQNDADFANRLAEALEARQVETLLPVFEGSRQEVNLVHRRRLAQCDAIALCWGAATEGWLLSRTNELKNWRDLKRSRQFAYRQVVAAPPPGGRKKTARHLFPRDEIDAVIDFSDATRPLSELIDGLVPQIDGAGP